MIISVSRRTDIPAFYSRWFMNRVKEGFCSVPNPFNSKQVSRVSLEPEDVDALVFWTRDPSPMVPHVRELEERGLPCFFLVTILDYPREYEPTPPDRQKVILAFRELSDLLGVDRLAWRYDPVILSDVTNPFFHHNAFSQLSECLSGASSRCIVSILDLYSGVKRAFKSLDVRYQPWSGERLQKGLAELLPVLRDEAGCRGFSIQSCAEERDLAPLGILPGACIDGAWISRALGRVVTALRDRNQRSHCLCSAAKDIGIYSTCPRGCIYCYATRSHKGARVAFEDHDPMGNSLAGPHFIE